MLLSALLATPVQAGFESYVETAIRDGVVVGDETGNVNAERKVTRGEFAVILTKFLNLSGGVNTFSDVTPHDWFADALATANHHALIVGDDYGNAKPYDNITRQDAVTIIGRYYAAKGQTPSLSHRVSGYAKEYWAYAEANGLLAKSDPTEQITKGEILGLLYEYDKKDNSGVRFRPGYPKISQEYGIVGHINIDICTNKPAKIYYALTEENLPHPEINIPLCETADETVTASIKADTGKDYDIYLLAVDDRVYVLDGTTATYAKDEPHSTYQYEGFLWTGISARCMWTWDSDLYFGDDSGQIYRFSEELSTDDGSPFIACWQTPDLQGASYYHYKHFTRIALQLTPGDASTVEIHANSGGPWAKLMEKVFASSDHARALVRRLKFKKCTSAAFRIQSGKGQPFEPDAISVEYIQTGRHEKRL